MLCLLWRLQRSEQYLTCGQSRSHFLRQVKGRWQAKQIFSGRCGFLWAMVISLRSCRDVPRRLLRRGEHRCVCESSIIDRALLWLLFRDQ